MLNLYIIEVKEKEMARNGGGIPFYLFNPDRLRPKEKPIP
jgi:hypothetical protein